MIRKSRLTILLISAALFISACSPAAQEVDRFFRYINDIRKELQSNKSEEKKQKLLTRARKKLLTLIDTEFVGKLSLGKYYDTLSADEQNEFISIFHEILAFNMVKTYIPISAIADQNINVELIGEEIKRDKIFNVDANVIHSKIISDNVNYYVDFHLHPVGKTYKLYDVSIDGASILRDYQNQFYNIISSKGFPYLLLKLKEKYNELDTNS